MSEAVEEEEVEGAVVLAAEEERRATLLDLRLPFVAPIAPGVRETAVDED